MKVGTCSEALMNVLDREYMQPLEEEEHAVMPMAGGILQQGYQCGQLWGASLAAGAEAFRKYGPGPKSETAAVNASFHLVNVFKSRFKEIDCLELTATDWKQSSAIVRYMLKGGTIKCFNMAAKFAPLAYRAIEESLAEDITDVPDGPVSCAAIVARKLGATDHQAALVAGFAGGIGLSGGGCGALGATIWLRALQLSQNDEKKLDYKNPALLETVDRFNKCSDCEFECSTIAGKKFKDVHDHIAHVKNGGCRKIIDVLSEDMPEPESS